MSGSAFQSVARIGLIGVGALVGSAFGQPALGAAVGGMLGGLLFPQKLPGVSGPRLGDQQFTTSTEGTTIPLVYGKHVVAGNFIWASPLIEVKNKEDQGGKGGPSQSVTTYTYYLSFAIALCEGPITGVSRIWENGKIIYDRRSQQDGESDSDYAARLAASDEFDEQLTIYLGDEEQLADPLIESYEGVGEVGANRGLAYVVIERREVTQTGGRPAQYQFEVTRADIVYTPTTEITTDVLPDWIEGTGDPRAVGYNYDYSYNSVTYSSYAAAKAAAETAIGYPLSSLIGWRVGSHESSPSEISGVSLDPVDSLDREFLSLSHVGASYFASMDRIISRGEYVGSGSLTYYPFDGFHNLGVQANEMVFADIGINNFKTAGLAFMYQSGSGGANDPKPTGGVDGWIGTNNCVIEFGCPYPNPLVTSLFQPVTDIAVRRLPAAPPLPGSDLPDWPTDPDNYWWDPETEQIYSKAPWVQTSGSYRWLSLYSVTGGGNSTVQRNPLGPVLLIGDPNDTEAFWTAARDAAVAAGSLPSSVNSYDASGSGSDLNKYPKNIGYAYTRTYTAISFADYDGTTVGAIVRAQCERSGLEDGTHFDVSNLTQIIPGYKIERVMNGRDIIAPLRQYALFDGLETDKLRFPLRGGNAVATLTDDDLGAHEPGSQPPPLVDAQRIEDVELPVAIRVRYADVDSEYQPGAQLSTAKVIAGKDAQDVETTIAMGATKAAQMVEIILSEAIGRRENYNTFIGPHLLWLTATDPILLPLRGEYQRAVIVEDTRALPGVIEAKLSRDDQSIYTSTATGVPGGAGEQTLTPIGDTDLVIIDGPALTSTSNDAGVFLAACGASDRWKGYGLFESTDGGANFSRIAAYTLPSTMGTLVDAIPHGPFSIWDEFNSFRVAMDEGTLESRTRDEVTNGANAIFAGADGRWEVIQFCDAVAEGIDGEGRVIYRLSTLLRGRQGTEWAIGSSQVGDRLALCATCQRLSMEVSRVGTPRLFKAVSFGRTSESGPEETFTPEGVALKPYAPWNLEGARDGSENLSIYGVRRTRISAEWGDSDYVPLNEDSEAYEAEILADGSPDSVLRTIASTSWPIPYTAAQQTADFGSPQSSIRVRVYQISASVGRGYPTEATL